MACSRSLFVIFAISILIFPTRAGAESKVSEFAPTLPVGDRTMRLNGRGLCEWGIFGIDLYWAGLYLERPTSNVRQIVDPRRAKVLELRFVRALTRAQLIQAWNAAFKANAGTELPRYEQRLRQLNAAMRDVAVGDRIRFTWIPAKGLRVRLEKRPSVVIHGDDFARLFFTLYLGAHPPDENLKQGLLGR